jgi:hypothetical protein
MVVAGVTDRCGTLRTAAFLPNIPFRGQGSTRMQFERPHRTESAHAFIDQFCGKRPSQPKHWWLIAAAANASSSDDSFGLKTIAGAGRQSRFIRRDLR